MITFAIYLKVPADPAGFIVDMQHSSPAQIAHAHHLLGTDRPAVVQYVKYMERLLHGDFGVSWPTVQSFNGQVDGASVGQIVWRAALVTGSLVLGGFVLLLLVAVPLGTFVATRPRSFADRLSLGLAVAAISTHPLVVGSAPAALRRRPVEAPARVGLLHRLASIGRVDRRLAALRADGHAASRAAASGSGPGIWCFRGSRSPSSSSRSTCASCARACWR